MSNADGGRVWALLFKTDGTLLDTVECPSSPPALVGLGFGDDGDDFRATIRRPDLDDPWWRVTVDADSATAARELAVALVNADRVEFGFEAWPVPG
jgi:hypothetical protein